MSGSMLARRPRLSVRVRIFLAAWLLCSLHFATNVVREHYPAMALVDHGDFRCDDWAGLSPDLFEYADGHWYANNQVGAALVATPVLFIFEPLLHRLDVVGRRQAAERGGRTEFDSEYPLRARFMQEVFGRGLHLRFGATAALTAIFVMAPCAGVLALLMHALLVRRGVAEPRATTLALLSVFATPVLFRSAILNHNQLVAVAAFAGFFVLRPKAPGRAVTGRSLFRAGLLAGAALLFDWSGLVVAAALVLDVVTASVRQDGWRKTWRDLALFCAGVVPPLALLGATQFASFGDPFLPAQYWMAPTSRSVVGWYGIGAPSGTLIWQSLVNASYGLFAFAPLLLVALLPPRDRWSAGTALTTRHERLVLLFFALAFLLFNAMNRYSELQWNTGFRTLAPLVPFLFLVACERLARLSSRALFLVAAPCVLHSWVLALARATPPVEPHSFSDSTLARCWSALFRHGVQLPWVTTWRQTQPAGGPRWAGFVSSALVAAVVALLFLLWRLRESEVKPVVPTRIESP